MIEVEKKFYVDDETIAKLKQIGEVVSEREIVDDYWDQPDFWVTKADCWLRRRNGKWQLKVGQQDKKNNIVKLDIYEEIEDIAKIAEYLKFEYKKGDDFEQLLKDNDYFIFCPIRKNRLKLQIEDFKIDIDDFSGDGTDYMEIELVVDNESEVENATQKILEFSKKYRIKPRSMEYGQVVRHIEKNYPQVFEELKEIGLIK